MKTYLLLLFAASAVASFAGMPAEYDVLVVGAGPAGICAATAAGEAGARTLLVERDSISGGATVTSEVNFPGTFHLWGELQISGCGWRLVTNAVALAGGTLPDPKLSNNPVEQWRYHIPVNAPLYAALAEEMVVKAGVKILYHTMPVAAVRRDGFWAVRLCCSGEMREVKVRELVDATGNGTLAALCGAKREIAPAGRQPGTFSYRFKVGADLHGVDWAKVRAAYDRAYADGLLLRSDTYSTGGFVPIKDFVYSGGRHTMYVPDADNSTAEAATDTDMRGRASMLRVYRFLRSVPELGGVTLTGAAQQTGVRETYRVVGEHELTAEEYLSGGIGAEAICYGCYPIDRHDAENGLRRGFPEKGVVPKVPFGSLVPKGVDHLLVVGRCISSDRDANSAIRVQATCMATGQAAGVAAALAAKSRTTPYRLDLDSVKAVLRAQGAIVPAVASRAADAGVKPTARQLEWADCEIGVIIHQDVQVYQPFEWRKDLRPGAEVFAPTALDTDQWIETAKKAGAKYAVLVAKHCSGFSLWPTKAHDYSVAHSPWKNGQGDVVADFIASCRKYGVKPGLYASTGANAFFGVDDAIMRDETRWNQYLAMVKTQLTELWSNYGELFEIWFDGGNLPPEKGGREIEDLLLKLQPQAVVFQGNPARMSCVRWIGNERAHAPEVCWNRTDAGTGSDGMAERTGELYAGRFDGKYWVPGEADMPNRDQNSSYQGGWIWHAGQDATLYPPEELLERYFTSVGRGCNLLLGMVIDNRGLVPEADVAQFTRFGELVKGLYAKKVASAAGRGKQFMLEVPKGARPNLLSVQEDLTCGELIRSFSLHGFDGKAWHTLATEANMGHRRLVRFVPGNYEKYRLDCWDTRDWADPVIRDCSLYEVTNSRFLKEPSDEQVEVSRTAGSGRGDGEKRVILAACPSPKSGRSAPQCGQDRNGCRARP